MPIKNNQLFIYGGIGILVVVAIVVFFMTKKKEPYSSDDLNKSANTLTLTSDSKGNLSTADSIPIGAIVAWWGVTVPTGWHECDGSTVNGVQLPDFRGQFLIGAGNNYPIGGVQQPAMSNPTHTHAVDAEPTPSDELSMALTTSGANWDNSNIFFPILYNTVRWIIKIS